MAIFEGAGVALVTPFTESGEVNYEKLEALLEEQFAGGTDAIIACGTIVGDHDVIFAGTDEVITFSHTAYSKAIFGKGALQAALFLAGKEPGLYDMQDVIG